MSRLPCRRVVEQKRCGSRVRRLPDALPHMCARPPGCVRSKPCRCTSVAPGGWEAAAMGTRRRGAGPWPCQTLPLALRLPPPPCRAPRRWRLSSLRQPWSSSTCSSTCSSSAAPAAPPARPLGRAATRSTRCWRCTSSSSTCWQTWRRFSGARWQAQTARACCWPARAARALPRPAARSSGAWGVGCVCVGGGWGCGVWCVCVCVCGGGGGGGWLMGMAGRVARVVGAALTAGKHTTRAGEQGDG